MSTTLLMVGFQTDYFKSGKMPLKGTKRAAKKAEELLAWFREQNLPVVHVQQINQEEKASALQADSKGAAFHKALAPAEGEKVVQKHYPNSFQETDLAAYLKSKKTSSLVVAGTMTHLDIDVTVKAAKELGYDCTLISDACVTKKLTLEGKKVKADDVQLAYLAALQTTYAQVISSGKFLKKQAKEAKKQLKEVEAENKQQAKEAKKQIKEAEAENRQQEKKAEEPKAVKKPRPSRAKTAQKPAAAKTTQEKPAQEKPVQEKPTEEILVQEKPAQEKPVQEKEEPAVKA